MQVESFRVFRDLVETKSFSRSASLNGITQSAVSQQLRSIEQRLRVPLLERTSKQFALTREGQLLYEASREIITHYQRLLDYIVPDYVHVLFDGKIVKTGGKELALELEEKGYDWIKS